MRRAKRARPLREAVPGPPPADSIPREKAASARALHTAAAKQSPRPASQRMILLAAGLIALAVIAVYHNSLAGPFVYDDENAIVRNQTIRQFWPIGRVLSPPRNGETVTGRPVLNLSLAINYALGGFDVWGYHAANLAIHLAAALLLFGILRRTFLTPVLRDRFGKAAIPLSVACALVWALHPLQTESVTYVIQRAESLAGLFYLLTLYCVIRGAGSGTVPFFAPFSPRGLSSSLPPSKPDPPSPLSGEKGDCPPRAVSTRNHWSRLYMPGPHVLWDAAAVLACLLGMATKEVMVTAPLIVLLYDRTFLAGSFARAWRQRWGLYLGLAATWGLLLLLQLSTALMVRQEEMGAPTVWDYACTQPGVVLHYLRLSVWPRPLCFDYAWPVADSFGKVFPPALVLGLLLTGILWGLSRRQPWAFVGAWFFLILAPTSSIMPLGQIAFEHRMYLSLAAVAVLVVAGGYVLWERLLPQPQPAGRGATVAHWALPLVVLTGLLAALGCATVLRNSDYRSAVTIYEDTVRKRPQNCAAQNNLGYALVKQRRYDEAVARFRKAVLLKPDYVEAHGNMGFTLACAGRLDEAIQYYQQLLRQQPDFAPAHNMLAVFLARAGRSAEALEHYQIALRLKPDFAEAHNNLGVALAAAGRFTEAAEHHREALRLQPDHAEAHNNLGLALAAMGKWSEAIEHYQQALYPKPDYADAHKNLGIALSALGKIDEAIQQFRQAARLTPDDAAAYNNLGFALASAGRTREAVAQYHRSLELAPDCVEALINLAWLLATRQEAQGGDPAQALRLAERAGRLDGKDNAQRLDTLAAAYAASGRFDEAVPTAERALQVAQAAGQTATAEQIRSRLKLYRAGRPYRQ